MPKEDKGKVSELSKVLVNDFRSLSASDRAVSAVCIEDFDVCIC